MTKSEMDNYCKIHNLYIDGRLEKLLNDFIKRNTRKSKIKKIFNND